MKWSIYVFAIITTHITGVSANDFSDIVGIVVAGCVGFVLLSVLISILVVALYWTTFSNNWMKQRRKVRMPKEYFKKKEQAKRRLTSQPLEFYEPVTNGSLPPQSVDTATLVRDWPQETTGFTNRVYEEQDATIDIGEDIDDEYKIETALVDGETLDVGPFKHDHSEDVPIYGGVYSNPYIYSSKKTNKMGENESTKPDANVSLKPGVTASNSTVKDKNNTKVEAEYSAADGVKTSNFEQSLSYL